MLIDAMKSIFPRTLPQMEERHGFALRPLFGVRQITDKAICLDRGDNFAPELGACNGLAQAAPMNAHTICLP